MATATRETAGLIGSNKVEGSNVYSANGERIGAIERVMIEPLSGKVSYAVLGFGGLFGMGDEHYPLPWPALRYDPSLSGYRVAVTEAQMKDAPKYIDESEWNWEDRQRGRSVYDYYNAPWVV
jgi:hypothetical protein